MLGHLVPGEIPKVSRVEVGQKVAAAVQVSWDSKIEVYLNFVPPSSCPTMSFVFVCLCKRLTPVIAQPDVKARVRKQKGEAVLGSGYHLGRELRLPQTYLSQGHNPLGIYGG